MRSTFLFLFLPIGALPAPPTPPPLTAGSLPLFYERNAGQFPPEIRYLARGQQFSLALTGSAAILSLPQCAPLRLEWEGAAQTTWTPQAETGGTSHYFRGDHPSRWRTAIPHYARVRSSSLYPGINLVFYGSRNRPEFDFIVAPHADPAAIRFRIRGAKNIRLEPSGELALLTEKGSFRLAAPVLYQPSDTGNRPISGRYRLHQPNLVGFSIDAYDASLPLVIDPVLTATYFGGGGTDIISGVTTDAAGNIYITGYTTSTNFPVSNTNYKPALTPGDADAFVAKLNPSMTQVLYATFLGGPFPDYGRAIAVDASGAAYITGSTVGRFPVSATPFRPQSAASPAIFVTKLNPDGASLAYSTYLDGAGAGQGIAVDPTGNAYVAGWTYTATFTTTPGAYQRLYMGNTDAFVVKLNPAGSDQVYSTFLGGANEDQARAIAINASGEAFLTGFTSSNLFPTLSAYQPSFMGATDAFITRLNASGSALVYSTFLGGPGVDRANAIALDGGGNAWIAGETLSSSFPTSTTAYQRTLSGSSDAFISRIGAAGTTLTYSTYLGGPGACTVSDTLRSYRCDAAHGIALDSAGQVWVTGLAGDQFPLANSSQTFGGNGDAFLAQFNSTLTALSYSSYLGGGAPDIGLAIAVRGANTLAAGLTGSANFPLTTGSLYPTSGGATDGFLARLGDCPATFVSSGSNFPANAGTYQNIAVSAPANCSWTVTSGAFWATVTNASGTGNGQFNLQLAENTGCVRTSILLLPGGAQFTMTQFHNQCVQFSPSQSWFPSSGGTYNLQIWSYLPATSWSVTSFAPFATVTNGSQSGSGAVTLTLAPNTGGYRYGFLFLSPFSQIFQIDQTGGPPSLSCSYSLSSPQQIAPAEGISGSFLVTSQAGCGWTAATAAPWLTLTSSSGSGDGVVGYEIGRNTTGQGRVATIDVSGQIFTVTQGAQ